MKLLIAHESADSAGGVEAYLGAVIPELRARGHEVAALYYRQPRSDVPAGSWARAAQWSVGVEQQGSAQALKRVRSWQPDVCFSHNMRQLAVERDLLRGWPVVKMMHGYFGTCASGLKSHAFPTPRACSRTFGPACLALYGPRHCGPLSPIEMMRGYRWAESQRALFDQYSAVVVPSAHMRQEYERHGVPAARVGLLPLFSTVRPADVPETPGPRAAVVFAGRMTTLKGGALLVHAAAVASDRLRRPVPLVMMGDGPQREVWQRLAGSLRVSADFTGWVETARRNETFRRASALVVPSVWPEPFGLVGLEAAAFGVPAIAFDVGGIREWLQPGRTGLLVEPRSGADGLAAALVRLLSNDRERAMLGVEARAAARRMSVAAHADRLEDVLRGVLARAAPAVCI